jgi:hypothetical protein
VHQSISSINWFKIAARTNKTQHHTPPSQPPCWAQNTARPSQEIHQLAIKNSVGHLEPAAIRPAPLLATISSASPLLLWLHQVQPLLLTVKCMLLLFLHHLLPYTAPWKTLHLSMAPAWHPDTTRRTSLGGSSILHKHKDNTPRKGAPSWIAHETTRHTNKITKHQW